MHDQQANIDINRCNASINALLLKNKYYKINYIIEYYLLLFVEYLFVGCPTFPYFIISESMFRKRVLIGLINTCINCAEACVVCMIIGQLPL